MVITYWLVLFDLQCSPSLHFLNFFLYLILPSLLCLFPTPFYNFLEACLERYGHYSTLLNFLHKTLFIVFLPLRSISRVSAISRKCHPCKESLKLTLLTTILYTRKLFSFLPSSQKPYLISKPSAERPSFPADLAWQCVVVTRQG